MMDIKDARKIIKDLSGKPFICYENCIETASGYVIKKREPQPYKKEGAENGET